MDENAAALIRIHPRDNVLVLTRTVRAGETVRFEGRGITLAAELPLGHKLAAEPISEGDKVLKYGLPIGTATEEIPFGGHVHVHNLKSDYLPTFTHEAGHEFAEES